MFALKAINRFLKDIKPDFIYCLITHCDLYQPTEEDITMKLDSFKRFAQVDCPRDHVIKFNNKPESLKELVD